MLKLFVFISFIIIFCACGVDTSSSSQPSVSDTQNDDTNYILDPINPNPIVDDGIDSNSSDGGDTIIPPNDDQGISIFDTTSAIYDKYACLSGDINEGYTNNKISDTSVDDRSEADVEDGVEINSKIPSINANAVETKVSLFYYDLFISRDMATVHIYEDDYRLSVDKAWGYNEKKILYVMTPIRPGREFLSCYRYDLTSITNGTYLKTKVYRYIEQ